MLHRITPIRYFHSATRLLSAPLVFNREVKIRQRDIAASNAEQSRLTDYLRDEVAERVVDRLLVFLLASKLVTKC